MEHVRIQIDEARRSDPDRQVFVTGHSLGGALAILWAATQSEHPERIAGVYTLRKASPKEWVSDHFMTEYCELVKTL